MTTFFVEKVATGQIDVGEHAAHHARVKRLSPGEEIFVTDGRGRRGSAVIASIDRNSLLVDVQELQWIPRPEAIHLFVPVADKDRMLWLAEKATELQATSWNPVMYERSKSVTPRGEGEAFDRKLMARMIGALEQSGGAWLPTVASIRTIDQLATQKGILLERDCNPLGRWPMAAPMSLAIGPEGGFTPGEFNGLLDAGWTGASLGGVTLRFETAALGALAIARSHLP